MSARLRERVHGRDRRSPSGDEGVSPVVGMILVLAISVVGISAILYWGLPAIDEMKANVEFRGAEGQFGELDATIKELVAGTTEKTAKRWQPTLNRGQISVHNNTEPWMFSIDLYKAGQTIDFVWSNITDGNETFSLFSNSTIGKVKVTAEIVTGTSSSMDLNVTRAGGGTTPWPEQMTQSDLTTWTAGTWHHFNVTKNSTAHRIENNTYRFRVYNESTLVAEAWYVATGRVNFKLEAGLGSKEVISNNGAIITAVNGQYAISNSPPIPPPSNTTGVPRAFARLIVLGGDTSAAGTDTFDMLISLYATATLASYDCALSSRADCITAVKYYNYGTYQAPWYAYLKNTGKGYAYAPKITDDAGASFTYLEDRRSYMGFTLLESSLKLAGGG